MKNLILVAFLSSCTNPTTPIFHFDQNVKIVSGFYAPRNGIVRGHGAAKWSYKYLVCFKDILGLQCEWIHESDLENNEK